MTKRDRLEVLVNRILGSSDPLGEVIYCLYLLDYQYLNHLSEVYLDQDFDDITEGEQNDN